MMGILRISKIVSRKEIFHSAQIINQFKMKINKYVKDLFW